jgi:hypothetical protein
MNGPADQSQPPDVATLRIELLLADLRSDVRLVLQRMEHGDRRADDHARQLERLDGRVDELERTAAPRAWVEEREAERRRSTLGWMTLAVGASGIIASVGTAFATTMIR